MNKLLVILAVLLVLLSLVQNAPVGRQRGKNKNKSKKAEKVRGSWESYHRLEENWIIQKYRSIPTFRISKECKNWIDISSGSKNCACMGTMAVFHWGKENDFFYELYRENRKIEGFEKYGVHCKEELDQLDLSASSSNEQRIRCWIGCHPVSSGANEQERERQN